jgi:hypothetical protein
MLRQLIISIRGFSELSIKDAETLARAVVGYATGAVANAELRDVAYSLGMQEQIHELKHGPFDTHVYLVDRFWRAMYDYINGLSPDDAAEKHDVDLADIYFAIEMLEPKQLQKLQKLADKFSTDYLRDETVIALIDSLEKYCYKLAWSKLRFIAQHDHSITIDDLAGDLKTEALRVIHYYSWMGTEQDKLRNYTKQAVHHMMVKLIDHHTAKCRGRIRRTVEGSEGRLPEYQVTTLSLDLEMNDEGFNLYQIMSAPQPNADKQLQYEGFVETLTSDLDPTMLEYVNIVLGREVSEKFEDWLAQKGLTVDDILNDMHRLSKLAIQYLGISAYEVRDILGLRLAENKPQVAEGILQHVKQQLDYAQAEAKRVWARSEDLSVVFSKLRGEFPLLSKADFRLLIDGDEEIKTEIAGEIARELCDTQMEAAVS